MNSVYLEVGIGLAVVVAVVATLADGVNEVVTRALNTRAKALWATIHGLLAADLDERPHIGADFILLAAVPSKLLAWLSARGWPVGGQDHRPRVGEAVPGLRPAVLEWLRDRIAGIAADEWAGIVGGEANLLPGSPPVDRSDAEKWLRRLDDLDLLAVAVRLGPDGTIERLYPPLGSPEVRRRLANHLRLDHQVAEVAGWVAGLDDPAVFLTSALPLTPTRREILTRSVPGPERARLEAATATEAYRLAVMGRSADERAAVVESVLLGQDAIEVVRRWSLAVEAPVPEARRLAEWLLTKPVNRQLDLLRRTTATGEAATAAVRTAELFAQASIGGLDYVRRRGRRTKVAWIDGRSFASAIWEAAKRYEPAPDAGPLDARSAARVQAIAQEWAGTPLGDYLATAGVDHAEDVDRFIESVGSWFDSQMSRLSHAYRRNVRWVLAVVGLVLGVLLNVNAVALTQALVEDAESRQALVSYADNLVDQACMGEDGVGDSGVGGDGDDGAVGDRVDCTLAFDDIDEGLERLSQLDGLGIPIVSAEWKVPFTDGWEVPGATVGGSGGGAGAADWFGYVVGIGVTGFAVSFGGVFWFDLLRSLTGLGRRR